MRCQTDRKHCKKAICDILQIHSMMSYLLLITIAAYCTQPLVGDDQQKLQPVPPPDGQQSVVPPPVTEDSIVPPGDDGQQEKVPLPEFPTKGGGGGDNQQSKVPPIPTRGPIDYYDYYGGTKRVPSTDSPPISLTPVKGGTKGEVEEEDGIKGQVTTVPLPPPPSLPPLKGTEGESFLPGETGESGPPVKDTGRSSRYIYQSPSTNFSTGVHVSTDGGSFSVQCHRNEDCYGLAEPKMWCALGENDYWTQNGCFCDMKYKVCVIERYSYGQLEFTQCRYKNYICGEGIHECVC